MIFIQWGTLKAPKKSTRIWVGVHLLKIVNRVIKLDELEKLLLLDKLRLSQPGSLEGIKCDYQARDNL